MNEVKVTSLGQVQNAVNNRWEFSHDVRGKRYVLSPVILLGMSLLEIITMINEGRLFYQPEL